MTLQQFEYVVALEQHKNFSKAAKVCGVTQSTLSSMVQKLENELDVQIFDRNSHPIEPTEIGKVVISQIKVALYNAAQIKEMTLDQREQESGEVRLGIIPTIAPYILPKLIKIIHSKYPAISLSISEVTTAAIIDKMGRAELDMAILATPLNVDSLLEVPIYYEKFTAYIAPDDSLYQNEEICAEQMPKKHLWLLKEGHCLRGQVLNICSSESSYSAIYEAGSIDTLVKIVDENSGYTIIPELHCGLLSEKQQQNLRPFTNPEPNREVSMVIRKDFVKEKLLNIMVGAIKEIVPDSMIDSRLKKFSVKL